MQADDNVHRNDTIRITELVDTEGVLDGHEFYDCEIEGPAVLFLRGRFSLTGGTFDAPNKDAVLWDIAPNRRQVLGAILANDCTFEGCTFRNIGLTGDPNTLRELRQHL